jgi:hypothetical protein
MEGRVRVSAHARPDEVTLSCLPAFLQHIHMQVPATTTTPLLWKRFAVQQSTLTPANMRSRPGYIPISLMSRAYMQWPTHTRLVFGMAGRLFRSHELLALRLQPEQGPL